MTAGESSLRKPGGRLARCGSPMKRMPARSGMGCASRGMRRPLTPTLSRSTGRGRMEEQMLAGRGRAAGRTVGVGPEPVIDVGFDRVELTIDFVEPVPVARDRG